MLETFLNKNGIVGILKKKSSKMRFSEDNWGIIEKVGACGWESSVMTTGCSKESTWF